MAAGGVGGYYGARMAAAGHDVVFFARGAHRDAMRKNGLKIESVLGDLHVKSVNVTDDPSTAAPVDIVLFAVKLWDTENAAAQIKPVVAERTLVITLQNGVDSVERLAPVLGADRVIGGMTVIATVIKEPGAISHTSQLAQVRCGRLDNKPDAKLAEFIAAAKAAGIDIAQSEDTWRDIWFKFVSLVALSGSTTMMRSTLGPILADPDTGAMFREILLECTEVARKSGVDFGNGFVDERFTFMKTMPYGMKASMLHDLERGNRLELDWLSGRVVTLGKKLGVKTPANDAVYAALKLHRMGARQ